MGKANVT